MQAIFCDQSGNKLKIKKRKICVKPPFENQYNSKNKNDQREISTKLSENENSFCF